MPVPAPINVITPRFHPAPTTSSPAALLPEAEAAEPALAAEPDDAPPLTLPVLDNVGIAPVCEPIAAW